MASRTRRMGWRRWRWLTVCLLLGWGCGAVERETTLTVGGDLGYAAPDYVSRGCDGEVYERQAHRLASLSAHARLEHENGLVASARVTGVSGRQLTETGEDARVGLTLPRDYGMYAAGASVGYDRKNVGLEVGASLLNSADGVFAIPMGQLRVGALDTWWIEGTVGTVDPAFMVRLMGLGAGGRVDGLRMRGAVVVAGQIVSPGGGRQPTLADDFDVGLEVALSVRLSESTPLSLDFTGLAARQPVGRLGLSWQFEGL